MIAWAVRQLVFWGGLALAALLIGGHFLPHAPQPAGPDHAAVATQPPRGAAPNALVFRANQQGHVFVDAEVNGAPVRFLVDTGATFIALTMRDAAAAGLSPNEIEFTGQTMTANGTARVAPVQLREVRLGQFSTQDVRAIVAERLGISLLGQTFLNRLDSYEMRDGVLTLNWN